MKIHDFSMEIHYFSMKIVDHMRLALQVLHEARLPVAVHVAGRAAERLRDPLRNAVHLERGHGSPLHEPL